MQLKSFVYAPTEVEASHTVHARDRAHAMEKLRAIYGFEPNPIYVHAHSDFVKTRDTILATLGKAPWQKSLNRQERRNVNPLI